MIGKSILGGPLVITCIPMALSYSFTRAGISKLSPITISPQKTYFGPIEFTSLTQANVSAVTAHSTFTAGTTAFADTSYTGAEPTDFGVVSWGGGAYASMGSHTDIEITPGLNTVDLPDVGVGVADIMLDSLDVTAKFAPNNLAATDYDALLNIQGATAIIPGQSLAIAANPLIVKTPNMYFTMPAMGVQDVDYEFKIGANIRKMVTWVNDLTFTAGIGNAPLTFATPS
jgi:hypothetical protein